MVMWRFRQEGAADNTIRLDDNEAKEAPQNMDDVRVPRKRDQRLGGGAMADLRLMLGTQRKRDKAKGPNRRQEEAYVNAICLDDEVKELPQYIGDVLARRQRDKGVMADIGLMLEAQRKRDEAKGLNRRQEEVADNNICLDDNEAKEGPKNMDYVRVPMKCDKRYVAASEWRGAASKRRASKAGVCHSSYRTTRQSTWV